MLLNISSSAHPALWLYTFHVPVICGAQSSFGLVKIFSHLLHTGARMKAAQRLHKCFHNFDDFCGGNSARKTQWCNFPNIWRSRLTCALPRGRSTAETNSHRHGERNTFRITLSDAVQISAAEAADRILGEASRLSIGWNVKQQNPRSERSLFTQAHTAADLQSVQGENWRSMFHQGFAVMVGVGVGARIVFKVEFRFGLELRLSLGLG